MHVRRFLPIDLPEVYRITLEVFEEKYLPNIFLEMHARWPQGMMVAEEGGMIVGFIAGTMPSPMKARVMLLAVRRGHRKRGVGSVLLRNFMREAERRGATDTVLEVRPSNDDAIRFYTRHGFRMTGILPGYYSDGEDGLVMTRGVQWNI